MPAIEIFGDLKIQIGGLVRLGDYVAHTLKKPTKLKTAANRASVLKISKKLLVIARVLEECARSQEKLTYECAINRTYVSSVERSERNVSIDNVDRVAKGLQIEPWRLPKDE